MGDSKRNQTLQTQKGRQLLKIAIIVLNYNGLGDTLECIDSLKRLKKNTHQVEIIVVDNNSKDDSQRVLSKERGITLIKNKENLGYAGGNNVGIKKALDNGADFILILNNDTIVDKSFLINLVKSAKAYDIVSPKIYFAPGFEFHKSSYKESERGRVIWYAGAQIDWRNIIGVHQGVDEVDKGQFSKGMEIDFATGACFIAKRQVFKKIGFFDERYFLYLEDMDFCVRAKRANLRIYFEPKAIIWHKNAGSSASGSKLQDYFITRNRLLFALKYANLRTKLALLKQIVGQIANPIKRAALLDFLSNRFGRANFLNQ